VTVLLQRHCAGLGRWGLEATVGCKPFQFFFPQFMQEKDGA
jgi:hypothetical protein